MQKVKFDCEGHKTPAYVCSLRGNNTGQYYRAADVEAMMNPRMWTKEMHDAWHQNIPDTEAAFKALFDAA